MARIRINDAQWAAIRLAWEYDADMPSYDVAAARAGEKLNFTPPSRQAISKRFARDQALGSTWQRCGSLSGINQAAQRKADSLVDWVVLRNGDRPTLGPPDELRAQFTQEVREESEDKRAAVLARHRDEWRKIIELRHEALEHRVKNLPDSFERAKLAKISAEITSIQQAGERKAWGLDDIQIPDMSRKSDSELRAILDGKLLG